MRYLLALVVFMALGCDAPPTHERSEAVAYCSTPKLLNHGYYGSGMHPCSNTLASQEACRRAHYKECLRVYR